MYFPGGFEKIQVQVDVRDAPRGFIIVTEISQKSCLILV